MAASAGRQPEAGDRFVGLAHETFDNTGCCHWLLSLAVVTGSTLGHPRIGSGYASPTA